MYRFALKVYGCQMNVYDGDKMKTALVSRGWSEVPEEEADVVILNGCSIRDKAEQKVWSDLGRYAPRWGRERKTLRRGDGMYCPERGQKDGLTVSMGPFRFRAETHRCSAGWS